MIGASLFSGIGAPEASMSHWHWPWHAEVERFPNAVMAARHPRSVNLGDVNADDFATRAAAIASPDVLVFGSPCQSFSVAGKRLGLDDPRGNLALVALRVVGALRPRWFVFENVPGLLSSDGGRDFGAFLGVVGQLRYGFAFRILDAQFHGVPQRRRRVFVVGHLGDWRRAAAVLFEPESLRGDSAPSREAGEEVAGTIASRPTGGGGLGTDFDCDGGLIAPPLNAGMGRRRGSGAHGDPLAFGGNNTAGQIDVATAVNAHGGPHGRLDFESETFITHSLRADGFDASEDGTGRGTPLVAVPQLASQTGYADFDASRQNLTNSDDTPRCTLNPEATNGQNPPNSCELKTNYNGIINAGNYPLNTPFAVALRGREGGATAELSDVPSALRASQGGGDKGHVLIPDIYPTLSSNEGGMLAQIPPINCGSAVRRLTPVEFERLQGFPDDYTAITFRNKPAVDGPRYKALGNSMAVPVMRWILTRIEQADAINLARAA